MEFTNKNRRKIRQRYLTKKMEKKNWKNRDFWLRKKNGKWEKKTIKKNRDFEKNRDFLLR